MPTIYTSDSTDDVILPLRMPISEHLDIHNACHIIYYRLATQMLGLACCSFYRIPRHIRWQIDLQGAKLNIARINIDGLRLISYAHNNIYRLDKTAAPAALIRSVNEVWVG